MTQYIQVYCTCILSSDLKFEIAQHEDSIYGISHRDFREFLWTYDDLRVHVMSTLSPLPGNGDDSVCGVVFDLYKKGATTDAHAERVQLLERLDEYEHGAA